MGHLFKVKYPLLVKLSGCTAVLLAATLFSLASILTTPKAYAQEKSQDSLRGSSPHENSGRAVQVCPMTQFLIASKNPCIATQTTTETFLPITSILPADLPKKEKNTEPTLQLTISTSQPTATLSADLLFDLVNNHRKNLGLTLLEHDARVCGVAETRRG